MNKRSGSITPGTVCLMALRGSGLGFCSILIFMPKQATQVFSSLLISGNIFLYLLVAVFGFVFSSKPGLFLFFFPRTNPATRVESWRLDFIEDIHNRHFQEALQKSRTSSPWPSEGKRYETCVNLTLRTPVRTTTDEFENKDFTGKKH